MDIELVIYAVIYYLVEYIKLYLCVHGILNCAAKSKRAVAAAILAGSCATIGIILLLGERPVVGMLKGILVIIGICFSMRRKKEIPIVIACFLGISAIDAMMASIVCSALGLEASELVGNPRLGQEINNISLVLLAVISMGLNYARSRKNVRTKIEYGDQILKNIMGIAATILFVGYYLAMVEKNVLSNSRLKGVQIAGVAVVTVIFLGLCIIYIYVLNKYEQNKLKTQHYGYMVEQQKKYYENLLKKEESTKKIRHDMRGHINVIAALIKGRKIEQAENYLKGISDQFADGDFHLTGNVLIDIVLNDVMNQYPLIDLICRGAIPEKLRMEDMDVCVLFSNLILNAAEAANQTQEKKVILEVTVVNNILAIQERNTYLGLVAMKNGKPETQKEDRTWHGFGIENMQEVVKRYDGSIRFRAEDMFEVEIILENMVRI